MLKSYLSRHPQHEGPVRWAHLSEGDPQTAMMLLVAATFEAFQKPIFKKLGRPACMA